MSTEGYYQLTNGNWIKKSDNSGPYALTGAGVLVLVSDASAQAVQVEALGSLTETAPASDTAASGLNGRLQRIAQRLTSLIAQLPASLGIKTAAASLSVVPASDAVTRQTALNVGSSTVMLPPGTTGNVTGAWMPRTYTRSTFQHVVTGTGVGGCVITIQASNDGVNPIGVPAGQSSFSFNSSTVSDGFDMDAPWMYARAVVSAASGSITSITATMVS